jgi:hypothetical protein
MASLLTFWCTTRQCEVATGIWIDAETLVDLALQTDSLTCTVCGRPHALKDAYLKPASATPMPAAHAVHRSQRRADAH